MQLLKYVLLTALTFSLESYTKMSTLLHDNFTLFSLQMQVTEGKSKVNGLRRYTFQQKQISV